MTAPTTTGLSISVTEKDVPDRRAVPELLRQVEGRIGQVLGDGAYDYAVCCEAIAGRGARAVIPPKQRARPCGKPHSDSRDGNVKVRRLAGLAR